MTLTWKQERRQAAASIAQRIKSITCCIRWERWNQVCVTKWRMVRYKGESYSRGTQRESEGVSVKGIWRWGCVTRTSGKVWEIKNVSHLNIWGRTQEKRVIGGREGQDSTGRKTFMSQISNFAIFSWSKKRAQAHQYLKRQLSACLPFISNISVLSLISHESTKRVTEWQEGSN